MGEDTWPANILNAMSWPTVILPSITRLAPSHMMAAVTSLLTTVTPPLASMPTLLTDWLAAT